MTSITGDMDIEEVCNEMHPMLIREAMLLLFHDYYYYYCSLIQFLYQLKQLILLLQIIYLVDKQQKILFQKKTILSKFFFGKQMDIC